MVIALRTPAAGRYDQYTQPVAASSEYTWPISLPTKTRPATTVGCPNAEVPPGKPNAHFNCRCGTVAAVKPAASVDWNRSFAAPLPQPFQPLRVTSCSGGLVAQRLGIVAASPAFAEPRNWPASDSDTRRRSVSLNVSPTDFMMPVVRAV